MTHEIMDVIKKLSSTISSLSNVVSSINTNMVLMAAVISAQDENIKELESRLAALESAAKADVNQTAEYQPVCPDCSTPYPCKCMTS